MAAQQDAVSVLPRSLTHTHTLSLTRFLFLCFLAFLSLSLSVEATITEFIAFVNMSLTGVTAEGYDHNNATLPLSAPKKPAILHHYVHSVSSPGEPTTLAPPLIRTPKGAVRKPPWASTGRKREDEFRYIIMKGDFSTLRKRPLYVRLERKTRAREKGRL